MSRQSDPAPAKQGVDPVLLQTEELESATMPKVAWRLVPFLCVVLFTIRGPLHVQFGDYGDAIAPRHLVNEVIAWGGGLFGRSIDHRLIPCQVILSVSSKTLKHNSIAENKQNESR